MYVPRKQKFAKVFKFNKKVFHICSESRGRFCIVATSFGLVTMRQLEAMRRFISRRLHKKSKRLRHISLTSSLTKKSLKSRMGKGVGKHYQWVGFVKPGFVLFELFNLIKDDNVKIMREFKKLQIKLPFSCKLVYYNVSFS